MIDRWQDAVPYRFRFAVKLWRGITHYRKLRGCAEHLQRFFVPFATMHRRKRGPLLIQLPPMLRRDERLEPFLDDLRDASAPSLWKLAIEFRHESWLCNDVYRLLDRRGVAVCLHDMAGAAPVAEPNDVPFVYVRRHGAGGRYRGCYSDAHIRADAERVRRWLAHGKSVFVYYNNDAEGYAVRNAEQLRERLIRSGHHRTGPTW